LAGSCPHLGAVVHLVKNRSATHDSSGVCSKQWNDNRWETLE
jgi:hypothetical protein